MHRDRQSIETLPTAALRANGSAQPTTGLRQIWTRALGPLASSLRWLIVRRHRRCSTPTGSRKSTKGYPQLKGTALSAGGSSICSRGRLEAAEGAVSFEG